MSIVTFWNEGKEQTGKTMSMVAIATSMAIEHNYRVLIISTADSKDNIERCFWEEKKEKRKSSGIFGPNTSVEIEKGMDGLVRMVKSNRIAPQTITNYTRVIFKDRFEVLLGSSEENRQDAYDCYPDIISLAGQYYDLVFVDLDKNLPEETKKRILKNSNLIVATISQRMFAINSFNEHRQEDELFKSRKTLILIGRYDKFSKYNSKNISRYLSEKNQILTIPYNTLFFEACEEASVPDMFLRFKKSIDQDDRNAFFIEEVKRASEAILYRLKDLQMNRK